MLNKKRRRSLQYKNESIVIDAKEAKKKRKAKRAAKMPDPEPEQNESLKKPRKRNKAKLIYGAIIFVMIALVVMTAFSVFSQRMEHERVLAEQKALEKQKAKLEYELKQVDTLEYVEEQARSLLKMVKPGEILYILPEKEEGMNE